MNWDDRMEDGWTEEQERKMQEEFIRWAKVNSIMLSVKEDGYGQLNEFLLRNLMAAG